MVIGRWGLHKWMGTVYVHSVRLTDLFLLSIKKNIALRLHYNLHSHILDIYEFDIHDTPCLAWLSLTCCAKRCPLIS